MTPLGFESEASFQSSVIRIARDWGWLVHHVMPARLPSGKRATALQGHRGFPDLVLAHEKRGVILAELKTDRGRLSQDQRDWIEALNLGFIQRDPSVALWRPQDMPAIINRLTEGGRL